MREDPFADVWQSEVVPQLVADTEGRLQVLTLLTALCRRHPGHFQPGQLRTLQRRVRDWRVQFWLRPDRYRLERQLPGGIRTRWETAPCHGALNKLANTSVRHMATSLPDHEPPIAADARGASDPQFNRTPHL